MDDAEEFDAVDRVGEGGCRRGGCGTANTCCDCDRPIGLVFPDGLGGAADRIFKCAPSRLTGFVGEGLS
jgi:hypothetical protein